MNKTQLERTKTVLNIIAENLDGKLLAKLEITTGLTHEKIKQYIIEASEDLK
jgi:hypothetical protein